MEAREIGREEQRIARQKLRIIRQQELAAKLAREGKSERARLARTGLIAMLNELDAMEQRAAPSGPEGRAA